MELIRKYIVYCGSITTQNKNKKRGREKKCKRNNKKANLFRESYAIIKRKKHCLYMGGVIMKLNEMQECSCLSFVQ